MTADPRFEGKNHVIQSMAAESLFWKTLEKLRDRPDVVVIDDSITVITRSEEKE